MARIKLITLERLLEMRENGDSFLLVEVLGEDSYGNGHVPGAINIPAPKSMTPEEMARVAQNQNIDKADTLVVYCASYTCTASTRAARLLLEAGFENVLDFKAGKAGWQAAGFELE